METFSTQCKSCVLHIIHLEICLKLHTASVSALSTARWRREKERLMFFTDTNSKLQIGLENHVENLVTTTAATLGQNYNFCPKIRFSWKTCQITCLNFRAIIKSLQFSREIKVVNNPQHFHEFFTQIFLTIFLVKSKLSTAKKSKTTTFSRIFHPKYFWQFFS